MNWKINRKKKSQIKYYSTYYHTIKLAIFYILWT